MQEATVRGVCPKSIGVCPGFAQGLPRGLPSRDMPHTFGPRLHGTCRCNELAWHKPLQWIINVRSLRARIWLCLRRLHGTRHCNGSSMCDRSVQRYGFACGLRPHAKPYLWTPLACAACMAHAIAMDHQCTTVPSNVLGLRAACGRAQRHVGLRHFMATTRACNLDTREICGCTKQRCHG